MATETNDLITEVTQLPVQPGAAMRLLWMLEDPRTSAADLGRLIESDPALSTQVIRLSNTAFYGLSGKVSSAWRAVTVLGLATVALLLTLRDGGAGLVSTGNLNTTQPDVFQAALAKTSFYKDAKAKFGDEA